MSKQILFLCTGNTCRSPMAEGFAKDIFTKRGPDYSVESAGLHADGGPANEKSVRAAMTLFGIDISNHKSRQVTEEMLNNADEIVTMTQEQAAFLKQYFPHLNEKIFPITEQGIADPYGGSEEEYKTCAEEIYRAVARRAEEGTWS